MVEGLPAGTVTLLFTDIEGSTRLLQQLGEKYTDLLAAHQQLLREACETNGGSVASTQGDSFFVAFPRAVDVPGEQADPEGHSLFPYLEPVLPGVPVVPDLSRVPVAEPEHFQGVSVT
jgi:hypothetical protein